jgi:hypothetical protein
MAGTSFTELTTVKMAGRARVDDEQAGSLQLRVGRRR